MRATIQFLFLFGFMITLTQPAEARNDVVDFLIKDVQKSSNWKNKVKSDIRLYFGAKKHPKVTHTYGKYATSKKTNAFNKTDRAACEWAFLSAVLQLQTKAEKLGANAIINIKSNHKKIETSSTKTFKCAAGNIVAGVALKGTFVKLR